MDEILDGNTFDLNETVFINPDEIACLASAKVPEGSSDECEALANDLWTYGQNHPVPAIYINKETATGYVQSMEGRTGVVNCHLESVTLRAGSESTSWKRIDPRVSKEKLDVKFYMNCRNEKMSVQHQQTSNDNKSKYRIDVPFNKIMGIKLTSDGMLTADVFGSPCVEQRLDGSQVWKEITPTNSSGSSRIVIVFHGHKLPDNLLSKLERIPSLCSALRTGLCNDYANFNPAEGETPHDRLPLVRDPTLVRAAQLAILNLRDHARKNSALESRDRIQQTVEVFGGIEHRFREILKIRLLKHCQLAVQRQHEE